MSERLTQHAQSGELRPYDFREHDPLRRQRVELLKHLHDPFAACLADAVASHVRAPTFISLVRIEEMSYGEFVGTLANPGCLQLIGADAVPGSLVLSIGPIITYSMIDRLLGGDGRWSDDVPRRPLTQIEQGLIAQVTSRAAALLADAWSAVLPANLSLMHIESDPALLRLCGEEENVTAITFEMTLGANGGTIVIGLPNEFVEALSTAADALGSFARVRRGDREENGRAMMDNLLDAAVELRTVLARTTLKESDLVSLQVGDVITTDHAAGEEVRIEVEGQEAFRGEAGQLHGNRAVRITEFQPADADAKDENHAPREVG